MKHNLIISELEPIPSCHGKTKYLQQFKKENHKQLESRVKHHKQIPSKCYSVSLIIVKKIQQINPHAPEFKKRNGKKCRRPEQKTKLHAYRKKSPFF